jgi:hypothetical protein
MSIKRLLSVIALAMAFLWLGGRPARAEVVTFPDLEARLSDCDIVQVKLENNKVNQSQIEVVIEASGYVLWWKGVGVHAANGKYYEVGTPGMTRRDSMLLSAYDVMTAKFIQLGKAKFLGTHTGVYEIEDLSSLHGGQRVTFTWVQDSCPDLRGFIDEKTVPDYIAPGTTRKFTIRAEPRFEWSAEQLLHIHFDSKLGIPAAKIDRTVAWSDAFSIDVEVTAPNAPGTKIYFNAWVNQLGGDSETLIRKYILVSSTAPTPPPTPPPSLVTVPDVRGMSLEQGRLTLAAIGLGIAPQGRDPSVPESDQTIYAQMPGKGSQVLRNVKINVSLGMQSNMTPAGFSALPIVNCGHSTYHLWEYVNDQWQEHEAIPPMWDDGGICPGNNMPVVHTLTDGTWQYYVVVDPSRCKEGNDPNFTACWAADVALRGDGKGPTFQVLGL